MTNLKNLLLVSMIACSLALTGCGEGDSHGHNDKGGDSNEAHNHDAHFEGDGHHHNDEGGDGHGAEHKLGEVTIAGTVLAVSSGGAPKPNATIHIDLEHTSGPKPSAIRVWVSDDSGKVLTSKGKAIGSGSYHTDATCPAELPGNMMLWIEVETVEGDRQAMPLAFSEDGVAANVDE